jgi:hypothetical protein
MFAKLAQIRLRGIGSAKQALATNKYGIGNRATCGSPIANSDHAGRPILVCHWQKAPATGALECVWQSVPAPATDEPRRARLLGEVRWLTNARTAARRSFRREAA